LVFGPIQEQSDLVGPRFEVHMIQLTETQQVSGTVQFVTKKGNPASVQDGSVVFASSDPAVLEVVTDPANPLAVTAKAKAPGVARLTVTADANLGDEVKNVELFEDFSVVGGEAMGGRITFGPPEEQPEA
jgi:hypothetical protein